MKILLLVRQLKNVGTKLYGFGIAIFILLSLLAYIFFLFSSKHATIEQALISGQRLEVSIDSGEIQGKILKSEPGSEISSEQKIETPTATTVESPNTEAAPAVAVEGKPTEAPAQAPVAEGTLAPVENTSNTQPDTAAPTAENVVPAPEAPSPAAIASGEAPTEAVSQALPPVMPQPEEKAPTENKQEFPLDPKLAWIKDDFVGPRLSDEMVQALTGGEEVKKTIAVEKVSIKSISEKPIIVIMVKGLGLSSSTTQEAMELPNNITMGFSPYSPSLEDWVKKAKEKNYEIVLNVPMETKDYRMNDPGPYALITSSSKEDNITRLKMLTSLIPDYKAVFSGNDEIFTNSVSSIQPVLQSLKDQGRYFVYGAGYSNFSLIQVAESIGYPILVTDVLLDDEISTEAINNKFKDIEDIATKRGYVVVMANPYPITIRMLQMWLPKVQSKGFNVSPVSILLGKNIIDSSASAEGDKN